MKEIVSIRSFIECAIQSNVSMAQVYILIHIIICIIHELPNIGAHSSSTITLDKREKKIIIQPIIGQYVIGNETVCAGSYAVLWYTFYI